MEDLHYDDKLQKYCKDRKIYDEKTIKANDKNRLKDAIKRKMTTIMIGSVAEFERFFGEIWGHGEDIDKCVKEQLDERAVWKECRERVMDLGNKLINDMEKLFHNYTVEAIKYKLEFKNKHNT